MPKKQFPHVDRLAGLLDHLESVLVTNFAALTAMCLDEIGGLLDMAHLGSNLTVISPAPYLGETKNDRLWEHVARIQAYPGTYVCGRGTAAYIDSANTHGWAVDIQEELDETLEDRFQSVLYFIGKYEDPLGEMLKRFRLRSLLGGGDGSVCQAGHSAGRPESSQ
jgi:hypothetical protein